MAALTAARMTREVRIKTTPLPLLNGFKAFSGGIACFDPATNSVKQGASGNTGLVPIGEFVDTFDNTGGTGPVNMLVSLDDEVVCRAYDNDGVAPVLTTNIFQVCYLLDDHTVTMNPTGNAPVGRIWGVDSVNGVLVEKFGSAATAGPSKVVQVFDFDKQAADGAAATATAESPFGSIVTPGVVTKVSILPGAALTADPTNNAVITIARRRAGVSATIATFTTTAGGTGSWVAWTALVAAALTNTSLNAGDQLTIAIAKGGTGVVVPISSFQVEVTPSF